MRLSSHAQHPSQDGPVEQRPEPEWGPSSLRRPRRNGVAIIVPNIVADNTMKISGNMAERKPKAVPWTYTMREALQPATSGPSVEPQSRPANQLVPYRNPFAGRFKPGQVIGKGSEHDRHSTDHGTEKRITGTSSGTPGHADKGSSMHMSLTDNAYTHLKQIVVQDQHDELEEGEQEDSALSGEDENMPDAEQEEEDDELNAEDQGSAPRVTVARVPAPILSRATSLFASLVRVPPEGVVSRLPWGARASWPPMMRLLPPMLRFGPARISVRPHPVAVAEELRLAAVASSDQ
ncbi:hypothetical protein GGR56DRAFT_658343 [Xylariaceae sp. FL0804]|nr:hypothetical protein GGR56DRAFT_658343 [Xylariaceae sp. FL0804]